MFDCKNIRQLSVNEVLVVVDIIEQTSKLSEFVIVHQDGSDGVSGWHK